ncbi:hypothetical protein [Yersinia alsatica]|uniref:hypothetical protein n=1 Tax=Yersinia alsatica TaxID=2890317 RepID=UPI00119E906D|nr:hypothetical protein [Yersinia alsatica]
MPFPVGSGFLTAEISDLQINNMWSEDVLPHLSLWEKIKDFFFSTHQEEALQLLFDLYHPSPNTTPQRVKEIWEQLKQLASPGYENCFGCTDSNLDHEHFSIEGTTLSIHIGKDNYTITNGPISISLPYADNTSN